MTTKTEIQRIKDNIEILQDDIKIFGCCTEDRRRIAELNKELQELEAIE